MKLTPKDWLRKYYPVPATKAARGTWLEAVEHALAKWIGLRPKTLAGYGLEARGNYVVSSAPTLERMAPALEVTAETCALCEKVREPRGARAAPCTSCAAT